MLKQIPREQPSANAKKTIKTIKPLEVLARTDNKIVHLTLVKLFHYLKRAEKYGAAEMEDLIHSLQRSILNLQKKKRGLIQKQKKAK